MNFYQAIQLGANALKPLIKNTEDEKLKKKYITALIVKDILCLLFCMFVVIMFTNIFGEENSIVGVVTVLALLTFRFSNLDFDIKQSAVTMMGIFILFIIGPQSAALCTPFVSAIINFIFITTIVVLSCHNTILCNQFIFVLSYLLLYGNEISSIEAFYMRVAALIFGGTIVTAIFYTKQRNNKFQNTIVDIIKGVNLNNERTRWQLKLSICICSAMFIGELLNLPKVIWIGISCMSIINPEQDKLDFRCKTRPIFMILGCIIFFVIYTIIPIEYRNYIGMIGGLMVGLSATYQWQTVFNCFGALTSAVGDLGIISAVVFRIFNTVFAALYSKVFNRIFESVGKSIFIDKSVDKMLEG